MKISIVIPNWNGAEKLSKHLPNVLVAAKYSHVSEIIVADDASTDNSLEVLATDFPEIKVVKREKNGGFASNVNFGVSYTDADFIVLLNSDASPKKDFLDAVLPHFNNKEVFAVGCNTGGSWARADFKDGYFWHNQASDKPKESHQTLWVSGGSGIFRKSVWDELGGLDTLFDPFYEEDLDLGYRATKRGYINLWEPKSVVEHYREEGVIAQNFKQDKINKIAQRNQLIFIWKNITSSQLFTQHQSSLIKKLIKHPKYWQIFLMAAVNLQKIIAKRKVEIRESKLTDEEILAMFKSS